MKVTVVEADKIGSVVSGLGLQRTLAVVGERRAARVGDAVVVRALTDSATYNQLELPTGRLAKINPGDVVVGALGSRRALKGFVGDVPETWLEGVVTFHTPSALVPLSSSFFQGTPQYRGADSARVGEARHPISSMTKIFATEAYQKASRWFQEAAGAEGLLQFGEPGATGDGFIEYDARHSPVTTIYGGTSEINRNNIAERHLGLPKSRR